LSNGYDSGLWHLAVIAVGLVGTLGVVMLFFQTTNYLKKVLVEPADSANGVYTYAARLGIIVVCAILFILIWKYFRDAHYLNKYHNKGMFGRPVTTQPNGLVKVSLAEYER